MITAQQLISKAVTLNKKPVVQQFAALFSTNILSIGLGVLVSVINTRLLGPEAYGDFKYLYDLFNLVVLFVTFGYSFTASRIIALDQNKSIRKKLAGGIYTLTAIIALLYTAILILVSFFIDNIYSGNVGYLIVFYAPLLFVFPFYELQPRLLEGENRIYDLSFYNIAHRVFYILFILLVFYFAEVTLEYALGLHLLSYLLMISFIFFRKIPDFSQIKSTISFLHRENKRHGFHVYLGSLVGKSSGLLGTISIGYFLDSESVGYYALAHTVAAPLLMVPRTLGSVYFKKFANSTKIPVKIFLVTLVISAITLFFFNLLIKQLISFVYSEEFLPVVMYAKLISIAVIIQGFSLFINSFLNSKGVGKRLLKSAMLKGLINITGFVILVRAIGVEGACYTLIISNCIILMYLIFHYKRYIRNPASD